MIKKILKALPWIGLITILIIWGIFLWNRIDFMLDSDMSSELILGKLLSTEKGILTDKWFYSTELRVLNTQIIFKLLFGIFDNWHTVRCLSSIILALLLLGSFYYLLRQLRCDCFPFAAICLILNFSDLYFYLVLQGLYYIPHICISFLTVGMIIQYRKSDNILLNRILFIIMSLLAVLSGLGGLRQILVLYLPLLCASVFWAIFAPPSLLSARIKYAVVCAGIFIMAMTGYVINLVILSNKFTFVRYTDIGYKDFDIQSVILVFNGILHTIGYGNGNVFSFISILNGSALIIFALMLFCIFSGVSRKFETTDINQFLSLYVLCAFMIFTLLYAFTDMSYQDRYNIPILVFSIPVITLNLSEIRLNKNVKKSVCIFILSVVYIGGIYKFNSRKNIDTTFYAREITQYLTDHNVLKGYATFWNANLLTELSNGRIEVWTHPPGAVETIWKDTDAVYKWLQYVDHANCKPDGEIFVIQTIEEYESTAQYTTMKPENAVFHNDRYFLFVFKNYNEMQNSVIRE